MINKHIYNYPCKNFRNRKHEGVVDLVRGYGREKD